LIIAQTYQIIAEIGAGGGGVVYLAEHLRLKKKVVLKADKRTFTQETTEQLISGSSSPQSTASRLVSLRREADSLKYLSHTNIPQVYDFVIENNIVYTVMDYIAGNSLEYLLKMNFPFSQAQIIDITKQLLQALIYLHSRPPHGILHADIKPANVMVAPDGETYLIDFNIALALGEAGAIAVGRSQGYASPEHYGVDFSSPDDTVNMYSESYRKTGRKVILTTQSDIYSLGATLYHAICGIKPPQNATNVIPLNSQICSLAFADIINKAMKPRKEDRWQSAQEMLAALHNMRKNDYRTKQFRRIRAIAATFITMLFLMGVLTTFFGLQQNEQLQTAFLMAEQSGTALQQGNIAAATEYALQSLQIRQTSQGQLALTNALNVYDLSDGFKPLGFFALPANPLFLQISDSGSRAAAVFLGNVTVFDTATLQPLATLPAVNSALAEVRFLTEDIIVYPSPNGITARNFITGANLWRGELATAIAISADNSTVAAIYRDNSFATLYNAANGAVISQINFNGNQQRVPPNDIFANPQENLLAINHDGSLAAVSFADGSLWLYSPANPAENMQLFDETSNFTRFDGGFHENYFAFSAISQNNSIFVVLNSQTGEQMGGFESQTPFIAHADATGIFVQTANILVEINMATNEQIPLVTTPYNILAFDITAEHAIIAADNSGTTQLQFFDIFANIISAQEMSANMVQIARYTALAATLDSPNILAMQLKTNETANIFTFDPTFSHHQARISSDWQTVMLYGVQHFRLYDIMGGLIAEVQIPNAGEVHDQQFRRVAQNGHNGHLVDYVDYLEVTYRDGTIKAFSAQDGTLLFEQTAAPPDETLFEIFYTDTLRIESALHAAPRAYSVITGNFIRELEQDAFLTYVTQAGNYIVTQYIRGTDGHAFGILLNAQGEQLAILHYLNDILQNPQNGEYTLVFNYPTGNLRVSRIYNIDDLIAMATQN